MGLRGKWQVLWGVRSLWFLIQTFVTKLSSVAIKDEKK